MNNAFHAIAVPIDFSPTAKVGIDQAIANAGETTTLHFCSVVRAAEVAVLGVTGAIVDPTPMIDAAERDATALCKDAVEAARARGLTADAKVLFGPPGDAISAFARESASDAILICTHRRSGFARALAGSVTEGIIASSPVPVIVAHEDDDHALHGPITVAVDGSPASGAALDLAIAIALARGQGLSILHSVESEKAWAEASDLLADAADRAREAKLDFELVTLRGPAAESITESARRRGSSLIVMGTRGRSPIARAVLGSVATGVIENASVPVVVVRYIAG